MRISSLERRTGVVLVPARAAAAPTQFARRNPQNLLELPRKVKFIAEAAPGGDLLERHVTPLNRQVRGALDSAMDSVRTRRYARQTNEFLAKCLVRDEQTIRDLLQGQSSLRPVAIEKRLGLGEPRQILSTVQFLLVACNCIDQELKELTNSPSDKLRTTAQWIFDNFAQSPQPIFYRFQMADRFCRIEDATLHQQIESRTFKVHEELAPAVSMGRTVEMRNVGKYQH